MPTHWESRSEPIPGYRLVERLGRGGFGEVWKAEAPGGLAKAIKFVHGELTGGNDRHAEQELKALERIRGIRHPFILSMERFDVVDGQLMIVMEIADCSLEQRLREHQRQGLPGIPRTELLNYLSEAAEALDLMNQEYDLQHLDIKPQNLFLIGQHVKVADFGLVKDLEGCTASVTGGVTPVYAPPETFDGWVSRTSDQYSLAIVYQELLTGRRPFAGPSARQYMMQHLTADPDVSPLPSCDRWIVQRALMKDPKERFPTCTAFVEALKEAGRTTYSTTTLASATDTVATAAGDTGLSTPWREPAPKDCPTTIRKSSVLDRAGLKASTQGTLRPTLVIGVGQTGVETLDRLRGKLKQRYGEEANWPAIGLLGLDVESTASRRVDGGNPVGRETLERTLWCKFRKPNQYFQEWDDLKHLSSWLDPNLLFQISSIGGTNGRRGLGRLALFENYRRILVRLRAEIDALRKPSRLEEAMAATGRNFRTDEPRVCIVASMGGGVGSGMFVDLCYLVRRALLDAGASDPDVEGFLIAGVKGGGRNTDLRRVNHFALAQNLLDCMQPGAGFSARYEPDGEVHRFSGPPAKALFYFDADAAGVPEPRTAAVEEVAADVLLHEATSGLGKELEILERGGRWPRHRSVGLFTLSHPLRELLWRTSARLCAEAVERWLAPLPKREAEEMVESASRVASQAGFSASDAANDLLAACNRRFESPIHVTAGRMAAEIEQSLKSAAGKDQIRILQEGVERLKELLGADPDEEQPNFDQTPPFEAALHAATNEVALEMLAPLSESLAGALDRPGARLERSRRAWEGYSQYLLRVLEQQQELVRTEIQRLRRRARHLRERVCGGSGAAGIGPFDSAGKRIELLEQYVEEKIACRIREQVLQVYLVLRGKLSDWSRDFVRVRQTLERLAERLKEEGRIPTAPTSGWSEQSLFPGGHLELAEAVEHLQRRMGAAAAQDLDAWLQASTIAPVGGLWALCNKDEEFERKLPAAMINATMRWLQEGMSETDAARAFFERHKGDAESEARELTAFFEWASPTSPYRPVDDSIDAAPPTECFLVAAPPTDWGGRFFERLESIDGLPRARRVSDGDACVFCRVQGHDAMARMLPKWLLESKGLYDAARRSRLTPEIFPMDGKA
jgi:serine/threonine protein kinase